MADILVIEDVPAVMMKTNSAPTPSSSNPSKNPNYWTPSRPSCHAPEPAPHANAEASNPFGSRPEGAINS